MTCRQEVCYDSLHSEPASALGLPAVCPLWGNPGMAVPRWRLSLSWPIQSDHLSIADWMIPRESRSWCGHECGKFIHLLSSLVSILKSLAQKLGNENVKKSPRCYSCFIVATDFVRLIRRAEKVQTVQNLVKNGLTKCSVTRYYSSNHLKDLSFGNQVMRMLRRKSPWFYSCFIGATDFARRLVQSLFRRFIAPFFINFFVSVSAQPQLKPHQARIDRLGLLFHKLLIHSLNWVSFTCILNM